MKPADCECVHANVDASRAAQQFPETVEDPAAVSTVIAQLRATPSTPSTNRLRPGADHGEADGRQAG